MEKYILFSPIGTTDPISNDFDGALLHICRYYKPEVVYFYLSEEMLEYHKSDDRYRKSLELLRQILNLPSFVIHSIEKPGLIDVYKFDEFYNEFEELLKSMEIKFPEYKILLNVSSGTPAMKGALQTMAALSQGKYIPIQVKSPFEKSNPKKENPGDYDCDLAWACNKDNDDSTKSNRIEISSHLNLMVRIKSEIIKKHLAVYDYHAAFSIADEISSQIDEKALQLILVAKHRINFNKSAIDKLKTEENKFIFPIQHGTGRTILEYLLWLQAKQKRGDFADFMRGITPVVLDLFIEILKAHGNIDIEAMCSSNKINDLKNQDSLNTVKKLERLFLQKTSKGRELLDILDKQYLKKGGFKDGELKSDNLVPIIAAKVSDKKLVRVIQDIRSVEVKARNLAAHEIESITDEWIRQKCCYSSLEILNKLKYIAQKTNLNIKLDYWNSYDQMNKLIEEKLTSKGSEFFE